MTDETQDPSAPLPQPPREVGEDPAAPIAAQQEPAEAPQEPVAQEVPKRSRVTLTVARKLGASATSLQTRYMALARNLGEVGVNGNELETGLREELNEAFRELHAAAPHIDRAIDLVTGVQTLLEEL